MFDGLCKFSINELTALMGMCHAGHIINEYESLILAINVCNSEQVKAIVPRLKEITSMTCSKLADLCDTLAIAIFSTSMLVAVKENNVDLARFLLQLHGEYDSGFFAKKMIEKESTGIYELLMESNGDFDSNRHIKKGILYRRNNPLSHTVAILLLIHFVFKCAHLDTIGPWVNSSIRLAVLCYISKYYPNLKCIKIKLN